MVAEPWVESEQPEGPDALRVARELMQVEALLRRRLMKALSQERVSPEQWLLLEALRTDDGQTQRELAGATWRELPSVTKLVDALVERGWVERRADGNDRRRTRAWLTDAGRHMCDPLRQAATSELDPLLGDLDPGAVLPALALFEEIRLREWDP